jgi:hypothetical protein
MPVHIASCWGIVWEKFPLRFFATWEDNWAVCAICLNSEHILSGSHTDFFSSALIFH